MELIEIKRLFVMDKGSPSPTCISNDQSLTVTFYASRDALSNTPKQRDTGLDWGIITIKFIGYKKYSFGFPNDETLKGHPYWNLGLRSYSFYEVKGSEMIEALKQMDTAHPSHNPGAWRSLRHFVLTFHDNMLECVAKDFEVVESKESLQDHCLNLIDSLI